MLRALRRLRVLQERLADDADENALPDELNRLCVIVVAGLLHLDYFGQTFDKPYEDVLAAIAAEEVSTILASLSFRGPDQGANGTRNWDIRPLVDCAVQFPNLRALSIEQTKPADHNRSIVAASYEEEGVLGRLLARAPQLQSLVTPSAPDAGFFKVGKRPIKFLNVDAGYDTQGFVRNLAESSCFPDLSYLEFGEFNETYMTDVIAHCTPLEDYHELFRSEAFGAVGKFVWRNPVCSASQIEQLKSLRPDLQLLVVRTSAEYVRIP